MMNDRFSAQLRQHLVETAEERAADGQLAALDARLAVTSQRNPLVARLTWFPGRVGPFPSTAVRYGLVALALVIAMVAAVVLGGGTGPSRSTVFEGTWTSTDPLDGSRQTLIVAAGSTPAVQYEDDLATGGACVADAVKRFTADGAGEIAGNRLDVSYPDGGGCGLMTVPVPDMYYVHDPGNDTLVDYLQTTPSADPAFVAGHRSAFWFRVPGVTVQSTQPPATQAPTPVPTSEDAPGTPDCIDLANGGSYTAPVGSMSLTAVVPDAPAIPWQGSRDGFHLAVECGASSPMALFAMTETSVLATSCMPDNLEITSFADAVARLDTPKGDDIADRVDLTIGGHSAARYDITNLTTCPGGFGLWHWTTLGAGETGSLYVIDVDRVLLAIELNRDGSQTPAELEEAWAIAESLQIAP